MIAAWLLGATCHAHPFGARFATHLQELDVAPDRVEVRYLADVPNAIVAAGARPGRDPLDDMAEELRSGLVLRVDGRSVALVPAGPYDHQPTDDTQQFAWRLTAELEAPPHEVELSNGNLPEVVAVFRSNARVAGPLAAGDCSLWRLRDGRIALDESDRWRTDERHRTLSVEVGPPLGGLSSAWAAVRGWGADPAPAADRYLPPLGVALRDRSVTPASLGVGVTAVGLACAAAAAGFRRRLRR